MTKKNTVTGRKNFLKRVCVGCFLCIAVFFFVFMPFVSKKKAEAFAESEKDNLVMVLSETCSQNEVTVSVALKKNSGVAGMTLRAEYDKTAFEYIGYEKGEALPKLDLIGTGTETESQKSVFNWFFTDKGSNDYTTGEILKLHFSVREGTKEGKYTFGLKYGQNQDIICFGEDGLITKNAVINQVTVEISKEGLCSVVEKKTSEKNTGKTVGIIVGSSVGGIALIGGCAYFIIRYIKKKEKSKSWKKVE